jgi:predicted HicB family RNase H-like nuclease
MSESKKRKVGRPSLPKGEVKKVTPIRFPESEKILFEKAAKKAGISFSEWVRKSLRLAAKRQLS